MGEPRAMTSGPSNTFADKYPEDLHRMAEEYVRLETNCLGVAQAKAQLGFFIEAINRAGWMLHQKPPPKMVHVGMAKERSRA